LTEAELTYKTEVNVRFSEVDSMGIVWHGNFIRYFEDGREAFGKKHGISYMEMYEKGYMVPLVSVDCQYKKYVRYGETLRVETQFINQMAAKIVYQYKVFQKDSGDLVAEGESVQVFVTREGELVLTNPPFFEEWKKRMGLKVYE
jgi:acyl-CoA thioester hydrolase